MHMWGPAILIWVTDWFAQLSATDDWGKAILSENLAWEVLVQIQKTALVWQKLLYYGRNLVMQGWRSSGCVMCTLHLVTEAL